MLIALVTLILAALLWFGVRAVGVGEPWPWEK